MLYFKYIRLKIVEYLPFCEQFKVCLAVIHMKAFGLVFDDIIILQMTIVLRFCPLSRAGGVENDFFLEHLLLFCDLSLRCNFVSSISLFNHFIYIFFFILFYFMFKNITIKCFFLNNVKLLGFRIFKTSVIYM